LRKGGASSKNGRRRQMKHEMFPLRWKDENHSTSKEKKEKVYPHDSGRDVFLCLEGGGIR